MPHIELLSVAGNLLAQTIPASGQAGLIKSWAASAIACDEIPSFLDRLEHLDGERIQLNNILREGRRLAAIDDGTIPFWAYAAELRVTLHLMTICVSHVEKLINRVTIVRKPKLDPEDEEFLSDYRELRNLFEHHDKMLPGEQSENEMLRVIQSDGGFFHFTWGLPKRDDQSVLANGRPYFINTKEVARVRQIADQFLDRVREQSLERLSLIERDHPDVWAGLDLTDIGLRLRVG